jgi:hypothetical protein
MSFFQYAYPAGGFGDPVGEGETFQFGNSNFFEKPFEHLNIKGTNGAIVKEETIEGQKYCCLTSTIYLLTDDPIDKHVEAYRDYFQNNLIKIWDNKAFQNKDLETVLTKLKVEVFIMPTYELKSDTISNLVPYRQKFNEGEVVLYLQGIMSRSLINADKRTGIMDIKDRSRNTPAHEFGHILGLSDRYNYFHFYIKSPTYLPEKNQYNDSNGSEAIQKLGHKNIVSTGKSKNKTEDNLRGPFLVGNGASVPMIEPYYAGDTEYGANKNWGENLMSLGGDDLTGYQLRLVCQQAEEEDYIQYSYFGPSSENDKAVGLVPSVIGLRKERLFIDINREINHLEELDNLPESVDYYYFNPTIGKPHINEISYYNLDGSINTEKLSSLEYGGKSREEILNRTLTQKRINKLQDILNNVASTGRKPGMPEIYYANMKDHFKNTGQGDEWGKNIWSMFVNRMYHHVLTIRSDHNPKETVNLELFTVRNFYFYYNRKKILEMYMLGI